MATHTFKIPFRVDSYGVVYYLDNHTTSPNRLINLANHSFDKIGGNYEVIISNKKFEKSYIRTQSSFIGCLYWNDERTINALDSICQSKLEDCLKTYYPKKSKIINAFLESDVLYFRTDKFLSKKHEVKKIPFEIYSIPFTVDSKSKAIFKVGKVRDMTDMTRFINHGNVDDKTKVGNYELQFAKYEFNNSYERILKNTSYDGVPAINPHLYWQDTRPAGLHGFDDKTFKQLFLSQYPNLTSKEADSLFVNKKLYFRTVKIS